MGDTDMTTPAALTPRHQLASRFTALGDFANIAWAIQQGGREYPSGFNADLEFQQLTQHELFLRSVESGLASMYEMMRDAETKFADLESKHKSL